MIFFSSFLLGLLTPLTATCVLPLYPGYIAYLAGQLDKTKTRPWILGLLVMAGVITFMTTLGIVFTAILKVSLTRVIEIVSPIAFAILGIISIFLIFNFDFAKIFPQINAPKAKNPLVSSFLFGFFFGPIVIPCNPAFIAAFFTTTANTTALNLASNLGNFLLFGIGIGTPLLVLSIISGASGRVIIGFLTKNKRIINLIAGIIMLAVSAYYLVFVFQVHQIFTLIN